MSNNNLPSVSVIAPCRNEAAFIEKAVRSILHNDYPPEKIEILVVDGMSTDGTVEIVQDLARQDNRIKLIENPLKIVPTAMNLGIKTSKNDYIVRIDCHSEFATDYIRKCIEIAQKTKADNVGGYIQTLPKENTPKALAISFALSSVFGVGNSAFRIGGEEKEVDTVPFGAFRKDIFNKVGLYDERLVRNQDIELNSRIRKHGGRIIISPEIKLTYRNQSTYTELWKKSFSNGLWNPYTIWLVGKGLKLRHFIPVIFILGLLGLTVGAFFGGPIKWLWLGYILLYLSSAGYFAIKTSFAKKANALWILWAYIIMHFAYGIGSLWGIITMPFKFSKPIY